MFQWLSHIENIITLLSLLTIVIALLFRFTKYVKRGRYIKGVLMSNNAMLISFPVRDIKSDTMADHYQMLTLNEVIATKQVINMCNEVKKDTYIFTEHISSEADEVHIGGPLANKHVNNILKRFEGKFWIHITKEHHQMYLANGIDLRCVQITENTTCYSFENPKNNIRIHYELDKNFSDLAIFVRISDDITRHIIFCNYGVNVLQTVKHFTTRTNKLYKFAKKCGRLKSNYFLGLPQIRVS